MDEAALIQVITELVLQQLGAISHAGGEARARGPQVVFVLGEGERGVEHLGSQVRAVTGAGGRALILPSPAWPRPRLEGVALLDHEATCLDGPPSAWAPLLRDSRALIVPNVSVSELAAVMLLLGLSPTTQAVSAALVEGCPVLMGADDVHLLTRHTAQLPKALVETARGHVTKVEALGIQLAEGQQLAALIGQTVWPAPSPGPAPARGRDVLTREDVEVLLRSGATVIEVVTGTIVTPLAYEVAQAAGVAIQIR